MEVICAPDDSLFICVGEPNREDKRIMRNVVEAAGECTIW
jgi:hypothetical protein